MSLDLGTFVLFNLLGFVFFLLCLLIRNSLAGIFALVAMVVFFGLALIVLTGDIVTTIPEKNELIRDGDGVLLFNNTVSEYDVRVVSSDYSIILNAVYLGLGTFNFILFAQKKWAVFGGGGY